MKARWTAMAVTAGYAAALGGLTLIAPNQAWAKKSSMERLVEQGYASLTAEKPVTVQSAGELEVAFSPNRGSTDLVIKVIHSAKTSIRVGSRLQLNERRVTAMAWPHLGQGAARKIRCQCEAD